MFEPARKTGLYREFTGESFDTGSSEG